MRTKVYYWLAGIIAAAVLAGFAFVNLPFHYGLDVQGGIRLVYKMDLSKLPPAKQTEVLHRMGSTQDLLVQIMLRRASGSLGVTEPEVAAKGTDQIQLELPGYSNVKQALKVMGSSARIELYDATTVVTKNDPNRPYAPVENDQTDHPEVDFEETSNVAAGEIKYGDPRYQQIISGWHLILSGDELQSATASGSGTKYQPSMTFSEQGTQKMAAWSKRYYNTGENLAFVLDGVVLNIAPIKDNTELSDNATIEGNFSSGWVQSFDSLLNSGALPVDLKLQSSERVDPTIGKAALGRMVVAGVVAFGLISAFLIGYYAFPGLVAFLALSLYVLFTLTVLKALGASFSLAGIAGFILSVGMAVDANVLVFERFKEEIRRGRTLESAMLLGFKRALSAIIDSNACTLITSLVLMGLGTGPVKGFATTLFVGVIISFLTAFLITRSLMLFFIDSGIATNPKLYAINRSWFGKRLEQEANTRPLQIVNKPLPWFGISLFTILISIPFFFMGGFKLNVELQGGYESQYSLAGSSLTSSQIQSNLERNGMKGSNVQIASIGNSSGPSGRIAIITVPDIPAVHQPADQAVVTIARAAGLGNAQNRGFTQIGPAIQSEVRANAVKGVILSSVLIVLYLAFRFGFGFGGFVPGMRFGISAIGALIHDILVVFGTAAIVGFLFKWEVGALFITAMLTIIGFSVHDTIVIFDRIRENLHKPIPGEDFGNLVNRSITQSFARSINTSMTVIATLFILAAWGTTTPDLKFFATSMLIGIVSGTYSSIYNASPILYLWDRWIGKKKGDDHTLVGLARGEMARSRIITSQAVQPAAAVQQPTVLPEGQRAYGQVRRRASEKPKRRVDDDDDVV